MKQQPPLKVTHRKPAPSIDEGIERIQRAQNAEEHNGIFVIKSGNITVSEHLIHQWLVENGYYQRNGRFVHLHDNVLTLIEDAQRYFHLVIRNSIAGYGEYRTVNKAGVPMTYNAESFLKVWMKYSLNYNFKNSSMLQSLPEHTSDTLADSATTIHFVFRNGVLVVTKSTVKVVPLDKLDCPVWADQIIQHDIKLLKKVPKSHYAKFIWNLAGKDKAREQQIHYTLGYLLHDYHNPDRARIPILYDTTSKKGKHGGTGKDVLLEGIIKVRNGIVLDGKSWKMQNDNEFFFSSIREHHRVVIISESKGQGMFDALFVKSQGPTTIQVKRKDDIVIPKGKTPKFAITSNMFIDASDSSNKRRQMPVILSGHYRDMNVPAPIVKEHGCVFYSNDWDTNEWNSFYVTLATIAQYYLGSTEPEYDFTTVTRQAFRIKHGAIADFIFSLVEPKIPDQINITDAGHVFATEFMDEVGTGNTQENHQNNVRIATSELSDKLCLWLDYQRVKYERKRIGRDSERKSVIIINK